MDFPPNIAVSNTFYATAKGFMQLDLSDPDHLHKNDCVGI
jgi:hypothetical protein